MQSVLQGVGKALPTPTVDPAHVRSLTQEILQRPELRPPRRSPLQALWHWIATELGKLLGRLVGGGTGPRWGALVAVLAVAVVVVVLVALTVVRRGQVGRGVRGPVVVVRGHGSLRSAAEWRAEAAAHEAAGRWRDALRCRYRALVAELAGRAVLEEVPGRTSGEYRFDVDAALPGASPAFNRATDLFEEAWYGDRPMGPDEQAAFDELAQRVLASQLVSS